MARLVFGVHPVEELLRAGREVAVVYLAEEEPGAALLAIEVKARKAGVPVERRPRAQLAAMAEGGVHQGVIAVGAGELRYREPRELVSIATARLENPLLLVLDGVQDPQNLGAIVRSAHCLGAHGLVLPRDRAARVSAAVVKASAGATEHLPIALCTNVARTLDDLKEEGVWTVAAVAEGGEDPAKLDLAAPTALVLGAEGKGVRPLVAKTCDLRVRIPMVGQVASLNVSAAAAILLYEAQRQRRAKPTAS